MLSKKDIKIIFFCIGLVCIGFIYDNACDYVMDSIENELDVACGSDPYCGDLYIRV